MSDRRADVYALLRSLLDWAPDPKTWTGQLVRTSAAPKGRVTKKVKCATCKGTGLLAGGRDCAHCHGNSFRVVDQYTEEEVGSEEGGTIEVKVRVRCPSCGGLGRRSASAREASSDALHCSECLGRGSLLVATTERRVRAELRRLTASEQERDLYAWEEAQERLYSSGSYAELLRALEWLRDVDQVRYSLVMHVLVYEEPIDFRPADQPVIAAALDEAVDLIAARMPETLRVPAWVRGPDARLRKDSLHRGRTNGHDEQRRSRNEEIWRLREEGVSVSDICRTMALQKSQVYEILASVDAMKAVATAP